MNDDIKDSHNDQKKKKGNLMDDDKVSNENDEIEGEGIKSEKKIKKNKNKEEHDNNNENDSDKYLNKKENEGLES